MDKRATQRCQTGMCRPAVSSQQNLLLHTINSCSQACRHTFTQAISQLHSGAVTVRWAAPYILYCLSIWVPPKYLAPPPALPACPCRLPPQGGRWWQPAGRAMWVHPGSHSAVTWTGGGERGEGGKGGRQKCVSDRQAENWWGVRT